MQLLKIFDSIQREYAFYNYLTSDRKYLHLSYIDLNKSNDPNSYNEFFDQLNIIEKIYCTI